MLSDTRAAAVRRRPANQASRPGAPARARVPGINITAPKPRPPGRRLPHRKLRRSTCRTATTRSTRPMCLMKRAPIWTHGRLPCEPGYYCQKGIKHACPASGRLALHADSPTATRGRRLLRRSLRAVPCCPIAEQCGVLTCTARRRPRERPTLVSLVTTRPRHEHDATARPRPPGTSAANGVITNCPAGRYRPVGTSEVRQRRPPGSFCPRAAPALRSWWGCSVGARLVARPPYYDGRPSVSF